ncbi:MAG: hypothetical protein JWM44_4484 [Bacilli bacterium]|nr:hypothetical protein [Bacilli bacterium]
MEQFNQQMLLRRANVSQDRFNEIGLKWDELTEIFESYSKEVAGLTDIGQVITNELMRVKNVHSVRFRAKDPTHLIEKIIRKRDEKPDRIITIENYRDQITDLIGIRAIHLLKSQWIPIHEYILKKWDIIEQPIAYHREGDSTAYIDMFAQHKFNIQLHPFGYRSLHYIISTKPGKQKYHAEIQVRTIFEEGWSEIDHRVRYPYAKDNTLFAEFLSIFNRLSGSADEMGSFIINLKMELTEKQLEYKESIREKDKIIKELKEKIENLKLNPAEKAELVKSFTSVFDLSEIINAPVITNIWHPTGLTQPLATKYFKDKLRNKKKD